MLCVLETGSRRSSGGCSLDSLVNLQSPIFQPSMEPDPDMSEQNHAGTITAGHDSSPLLAHCDLVSVDSTSSESSSNIAGSSATHTANIPFRTISLEQSTLEDVRLAGVWRSLQDKGYSSEAIYTLIATLEDSSNSLPFYRRAQYLFIQWALQHDIDINNYSSTDLINFLSAAYAALFKS